LSGHGGPSITKEILIAESDQAVWEDFKGIFAQSDYRLIFSGNGEDAYQQVVLFRPDLVIAAVSMLGERGGFQLCTEIKSDKECGEIPVVLLKGVFDEVSDADGDRCRADGVISKPLEREEILDLVDRLTAEGTMEKKKDSLLDELDRLDREEIIELVDVIEEPEPKVKISDRTLQESKTSLDDWEKPTDDAEAFVSEQESSQVDLKLNLDSFSENETPDVERQIDSRKAPESQDPLGELAPIETWDLALTGQRESGEEGPPEDELTLSLDLGAGKPAEKRNIQSSGHAQDFSPAGKQTDAALPPNHEVPDRSFSLEEFENALHREVKTEFLEPENNRSEYPIMPPPMNVPGKPTDTDALEVDFESLFQEEPLDPILSETPSEVSLEEEDLTKVPEQLQDTLVEEEEIGEGDVRPVFAASERKRAVAESTRSPERAGALSRPDQQAQELIAKGIQRMMDDFVQKVVPEMAQHMVALTMARIEAMVRDMIPGLAEKAIQEEIKRLKGDEKE
jgi:CheY-like chemotaxis protein